MRPSVLAGIDGSEYAATAADWAAREATLRGIPLRLLHVSPRLRGDVPGPARDRLRQLGAQLVQRTVDDLAGRYPGLESTAEQADGAPADALVRSAAHRTGLVVVGTRGAGGFKDLLVGSVALRTAAAAGCPVVLVPPRIGTFANGSATRGTGLVVLGFDAHRPVGEAADFAFSAAATRGARLRVVQAWNLPAESVSPRTLVVTEEDRATWEDQEDLELSDALRPWQEKHPRVPVTTDLMLLHPAEALLNASHGADLLVVGRRSDPDSAEGRLGPVTHAVLHHARCPVAVIPHDG